MTLYINSINNDVTLNKKQYLLRAATRLGLDVREWTPQIGADAEYVLNIEPYDFRTGRLWTGIWEIDLLLDRREMSESSWAVADTIFTAISTLPPRMLKFREKTRLLFQAVDPEIHRRIEEIKQDYDIVFAGSLHAPVYTERERIYALLRQDYRFCGYDRTIPETYMRHMNTGRIQFMRSMSSPIGNGELAQRFFEGLAIGPVLTNYVPDLEHTGLREGEDYLCYTDDEDMDKKVRLLLENAEFAQKVAQNGRIKAMLYHTYEHRLISILNTIKYGNI